MTDFKIMAYKFYLQVCMGSEECKLACKQNSVPRAPEIHAEASKVGPGRAMFKFKCLLSFT